MRRFATAVLLIVSAELGGCAGGQQTAPSGPVAAAAAGGGDVSGNERGGRIANALANTNTAYASATAHCQRYGKRSFITKWDPPNDRGAIIFECK
jgi:hypothetical protein